MSPALSIIIPAYDEEKRLGGTISEIVKFLESNEFNAELIVVDDGSSDRTTQTAESALSAAVSVNTKLVSYRENRGKGFAVRSGLESAAGEIALFTDADLSTPIDEMSKLINPIKSGEYDVTFGSRALDRTLIGTHQPWRREQGAKVFNAIVRTLTRLPFWDTQCGFKAFRMSVFRPLLPLMQIDRFGFDVEFLYVAKRRNLRLLEIPVRWNHDERTKVNVFRDSIKMFNEVREIRRNARNGKYDAAAAPQISEQV